jgi:hypothetical protein
MRRWPRQRGGRCRWRSLLAMVWRRRRHFLRRDRRIGRPISGGRRGRPRRWVGGSCSQLGL